MSYWTLGCCSKRIRDRFSLPDCLFVQLPLVNGFLTSFSREAGIHLSLSFVEGFFCVDSGTTSCIIRMFDFLNKRLDFWISRSRGGFIGAVRCFSRRVLISNFDFGAPARFDLRVQPVQGGIGPVCNFSHPALLEQPSEHRPFHGLAHQGLRFFDFREFSHGAMTIAYRPRKVEREVVQSAADGSG